MLRRAFTLVELLVVIAVIGVLVALLLPAVQAAREAARMSQCKSNFKEVGLAVLNFEAAHGTLPPIRARKSRLSWQYSILPFLEEHAIYDQLQNLNRWEYVQANGFAVDPQRPAYIASYQCPTSPGVPQLIRGHIVAKGENEGYKIFDALGRSHDNAPYNLGLYGSCAWYGPTRLLGPRVGNDDWSPAKLQKIVDGLSNTILIGEQAGPKYKVDGKPVGQNFLYSVDRAYTAALINANPLHGLYSYHAAEGAHATMCDGSVRFLPEDTPEDELLSLFLRADSETGIEIRLE